MATVVTRRHLLDGTGPIDRDTMSRLVYKKIIITYDSGTVMMFWCNYRIVLDAARQKWIREEGIG